VTHLQRFSNWLHQLPDWQFTGMLYLLRWLVVVPLSWLLAPLGSPDDVLEFEGSLLGIAISFLIVAPVLETLLECTLPYLLIHGLLKTERHSPWPFVIVSALAMVVLHPLTPRVITFAFITGAFLAYVYYRFAAEDHRKAFLHTAVFHAGINIVGWTMIVISS
jgi:hypothetical protein